MCGIAGIAWTNEYAEGPPEVVGRMCASLVHRGPDSDGRARCAFADVGFRRLAIIDLTSGDQPVRNEDGSIEVFLNGEIYNYLELRQQLLARGHVFHTTSDTEVLPHLYEDHGEEMFTRLNGMFAICILDHRRKQVMVARDQVGVKQIYYAPTKYGVLFASELKAVLAAGILKPEVADEHLLGYLTLFYTPEPNTLVRGVSKLAPGELLCLRNGRIAYQRRYYRLAPEQLQAPDLKPDEVRTHVEALLGDAVRLQLQADVPVGISLSGGLDSSIVAVEAAKAGNANVRAITIRWPGAVVDEGPLAAELCRKLDLPHEILEPDETALATDLPALARMCDEPIADPALYSQYLVARLAREKVKVLLSGAGGDELFGGYGRYRLQRRLHAFVRLPEWLRRMTAGLARIGGFRQESLEILCGYDQSRFAWHAAQMSSASTDVRTMLQQVIPNSASPFENMRRGFETYHNLEPINQQMVVDYLTYLPDQVLPMIDRATMAASIEGRVPLLDIRLAELSLSLSAQQKLGPGDNPKWLLKQMGRASLTPGILNGRKFGFPSPVRDMIEREHKRVVAEVLLARDGFVSGRFPRRWLEGLLATPQSAVRSWCLVYGLLVLELWHRLFFTRREYTAADVSTVELLASSERAA